MKRKSKYCVAYCILIFLLFLGCTNEQDISERTEPQTSKSEDKEKSYDIDEKMLQGNGFLSAKLYDEALLCFTQIIESDPSQPKAYIGLADANIGLADLSSAEKALRTGIVSIPLAEEIYIRLYRLLTENKRGDEAMQILAYGYEKTNSEEIMELINEIDLQRGNYPLNLANNGYLAHKGDWVYFQNSSDNFYLYKAKLDGSLREKLDDSIPMKINVVGDWVYYIDGKTYLSYRIKTDGTEKEQFYVNGSIETVVGEWVYLFDSNEIYRMKPNNPETELITSNVQRDGFLRSAFIIHNDWIYYYDNSGLLCKVYIDGTDNTILGDKYISELLLEVGKEYLEKDEKSQSYVEGSSHQIVSDLINYKTAFNVSNGWIYYVYSDFSTTTPATTAPAGEGGKSEITLVENDTTIRKIRFNGEEDQVLVECNDDALIYIIGEWIYYMDYRVGDLRKMRKDGSENSLVK